MKALGTPWGSGWGFWAASNKFESHELLGVSSMERKQLSDIARTNIFLLKPKMAPLLGGVVSVLFRVYSNHHLVTSRIICGAVVTAWPVRTRVWAPRTHVKENKSKDCIAVHACNPSYRGRDWRIPGAHWPASPACSVLSRLAKEPVSTMRQHLRNNYKKKSNFIWV